MAILWELIDDHPTNDVLINMNLIIVHHTANAASQPYSLQVRRGHHTRAQLGPDRDWQPREGRGVRDGG